MMRSSFFRHAGGFSLATLLLCMPSACPAQDFYRHEAVELQILRAGTDKAFLILTRREGLQPPEVLAAGIELKVHGAVAETAPDAETDWRVVWQGESAKVTTEGDTEGSYRRESQEERLAAAKARAEKLDAELNRIYADVKSHLPAAGIATLREAQLEWIRFAYETVPGGPEPDSWLARGDRAAERIRFLTEARKDPALLEAQALRAQLKAAQEAEAWPAVAEIARRLLLAAPRDSELWETRARAFSSATDWPRCATALREWARAVPQPPPAIDDLRGDVADGEDEAAGAVRAWTAYVKAVPKDTAVRDKLAEELQEQGDWPAAGAVLEQRLKIEAAAASYARLAVVHATLRDWKRMSADIRRGSKLDPADDEVKETLPRVERLEKALPAVTALERPIAAAKADPNPLLDRALLFLQAGWPAVALDDIGKAESLAPKSRRAVLEEAAALLALDRRDEAEALGVAINHDPLQHAEALRGLGQADAQIQRGGANAAPSLARRATLLNECEQSAFALEDADAALQLEKENGEALTARGHALAALGREWEALPTLQRATELNPRDAQAWVTRGRIEAQFHRHDAAIGTLAQALQLAPDNREALKLREESLRSLGKVGEADADAAHLRRLSKPAARE